MNAKLNAELGNARQCLLDTFHLALTYGSPDCQDSEKYLELAAQLSTINEECKREEAALESAKESGTLDNFEREYEKKLEDLKKKKYDAKKSAEFKEFKAQLELFLQATQLAELASTSTTTRIDEDFEMESEINIFDPLTKQRMKNPVRNTKCGHHYEKSTILEAIQINERLRCPVAGCGNKQFVVKRDLQDDNLFKVRLQKIADNESQDC